jgi:hypothetical protein
MSTNTTANVNNSLKVSRTHTHSTSNQANENTSTGLTILPASPKLDKKNSNDNESFHSPNMNENMSKHISFAFEKEAPSNVDQTGANDQFVVTEIQEYQTEPGVVNRKKVSVELRTSEQDSQQHSPKPQKRNSMSKLAKRASIKYRSSRVNC